MRKSDFTLPTLDDLFSTQAERDDAKLERVRNIPLAELHPFKGHPFKVQNNEEMQRMIESIRKVGAITLALARLRAEFEPPKEVRDLSGDMLFADYLREWLEIAKGRLAVATYSSYAAMIKKPVGPYFRQRNLTLRELEARHLQMFYSEMLRKVKPNTVIHYHAIIHSALKYAVKTDMLIQNVAEKVDRLKKNNFQPVFLDADELQHLFEVVKGTKFELPVLVAAFYGLRRGEVVGIKWDTIDFECGTITIRHTVPSLQVDGKTKMYAQDSAKTKSSMRTLPLVDSFAEYFKEVKAAQEVNKKVCGNCYNYEYDGYVFVDELGNLMKPDYLTSQFPKFIQNHGCKRMRFHDLRHSCASLLPQTASAPSLFESLFLFCQSKKQALRPAFHFGGELGIRTLGTLRTQHFECCTFDHSDNSPCFSLLRHARLHIATCIIPNISILVNKNKHQIINFLYVLK